MVIGCRKWTVYRSVYHRFDLIRPDIDMNEKSHITTLHIITNPVALRIRLYRLSISSISKFVACWVPKLRHFFRHFSCLCKRFPLPILDQISKAIPLFDSKFNGDSENGGIFWFYAQDFAIFSETGSTVKLTIFKKMFFFSFVLSLRVLFLCQFLTK